MTATTSDRNTQYKQFGVDDYDVYQSTSIPSGVMVGVSTSHGYAVNGATSTAMRIVGVSSAAADNSSGSSGDIKVKVKAGKFLFGNSSGGDEITQTEIGSRCYCVDNQTVAKTSGSGTRVAAGIVEGVDANGNVWVAIGEFNVASDVVTLTGSETLTNKTLTSPTISDPAITGINSPKIADASFTANDCALAVAGADSGGHYVIDTTAGASTVSLTAGTGLAAGDFFYFVADGTKNGHTVTYRDGSTNISAAATASKRHITKIFYDGTNFYSQLVVGP